LPGKKVLASGAPRIILSDRFRQRSLPLPPLAGKPVRGDGILIRP
jgi:hypothetical protein